MSNSFAFSDPSLPAQERARLLLAEMTIEEKAQQLTCIQPQSVLAAGALKSDALDAVLGNGIGQVAPLTSTGGTTPQRIADEINLIQRHLVQNTRLGVPAVFHNEAIAGLQAPGHTVFPTETGVAATWSPELSARMGDLVRRQMRRLGLTQALGPVLDVALEPRWGRVHETYGEDPYLAAAFGVAYISGLQGDDLATGVVATAKHFLGYGASEGGLNSANVEAGSRRVRDVFAFPFEAAIQLVGLRSVMNTYSEVNGVPAAISTSCSPRSCARRSNSRATSRRTTSRSSMSSTARWLRRTLRRQRASASKPDSTLSCPHPGLTAPPRRRSPRGHHQGGARRRLGAAPAHRASSSWASSNSPTPPRRSIWRRLLARAGSSRTRWRTAA